MKIRWVAWVIIAACGVIIWLMAGTLKSELAPLEDRNNVTVHGYCCRGHKL